MVVVALQVCREMQLRGLRPDVATLTAVITTCGKGWMADLALRSLVLRLRGLQPVLFTCAQ